MSIIGNPPGLLGHGQPGLHTTPDRTAHLEMQLQRRSGQANRFDSGRAIEPERPRAAFYALGRFRVHFNRAGAAPLVWCVASIDGQWEIAVREVTINGHARTVYAPKSTSDDEDGKPSAWISVDGRLDVLVDGRALISALDGADQQSPG